MASRFDLTPRLAALQAAGLIVKEDYQGSPAQWLKAALGGCDARVINCKGVRADDTPVLVSLAWLENMVAAVGKIGSENVQNELTEKEPA